MKGGTYDDKNNDTPTWPASATTNWRFVDMPDNVSAAAFVMAVAGGGAVKSHTATPLMSIEDGIEALKRGAKSGYKPATK